MKRLSKRLFSLLLALAMVLAMVPVGFAAQVECTTCYGSRGYECNNRDCDAGTVEKACSLCGFINPDPSCEKCGGSGMERHDCTTCGGYGWVKCKSCDGTGLVEAATYTVTFAAQGGGRFQQSSLADVAEGAKVSTVATDEGIWVAIEDDYNEICVYAFPEKGYEFDHWEGVPADKRIHGDTTITAVFKKSDTTPTTPTTPAAPKAFENFSTLRFRETKSTKDSLKVEWKSNSSADGYILYAAQSGKSMKSVATIKKGKTAQVKASLAKGKGTATVYAYAHNGLYKTVKVTMK